MKKRELEFTDTKGSRLDGSMTATSSPPHSRVLFAPGAQRLGDLLIPDPGGDLELDKIRPGQLILAERHGSAGCDQAEALAGAFLGGFPASQELLDPGMQTHVRSDKALGELGAQDRAIDLAG